MPFCLLVCRIRTIRTLIRRVGYERITIFSRELVGNLFMVCINETCNYFHVIFLKINLFAEDRFFG